MDYKYDNLIVGCGLTGAVLAERLASQHGESSLIIDSRNHIGGNVYDYKDKNGITIHKYGPHVFHTNNDEVWQYLSKFTEWHHFFYHVKAIIDGKQVDVPFNLNSLYQVFPNQLAARLENKLIDMFGYNTRATILELKKIDDPDIQFIADFVYKKIFLQYTLKQWGVKPEDLDPSVSGRVPILISKDARYFQDKYQAIPKLGYSSMIKKMISNPLISLQLNTEYKDIKNLVQIERVFYTGMIDEFFNYKHGKLPYRSLQLKFVEFNQECFQEYPQINYTENYDFTRSVEYKKYLNEKSEKTVVSFEYPEDYIEGKNDPYYPIPTDDNNKLYQKYLNEAKKLNNTYFCGRLGDYKYYNMDIAVEKSLNLFKQMKQIKPQNKSIKIAVAYHKPAPIFKNECLMPIHVGALHSEIKLGDMQRDDTGDNISEKNLWYAELTALYWIWKNDNSEAKGLMHYRRLLDFTSNYSTAYYEKDISSLDQTFINNLGITESHLTKILDSNDIITCIEENLHSWSNYSVEEHYRNSHTSEHIDLINNILLEFYPQYHNTWKDLLKGNKAYFTNIFIAKKTIFNNYCEWIFDILSKLEEKINPYEKQFCPFGPKTRWAGFMAERLTSLYIMQKQKEMFKIKEFPRVHITFNNKFYELETYDQIISKDNTTKQIEQFHKNTPKVSVILAAFNNETTITQCINSILSQTIINLEIIITDDCSTDNTANIIREFKQIDNRIQIITNKQNSGLSLSRKIGHEAAKGEYIYFCDSDDFLDNDYLELMVKRADDTKADIVVSRHKCINFNGNKLFESTFPHTLLGNNNYNINSNLDILLLPPHVWDKLFRKCKISSNYWANLKCGGEDVQFWWLNILNNLSVNCISATSGYNYRINSNSVQSKISYITGIFPCLYEIIKQTKNSNIKITSLLYLNFKAIYLHQQHRGKKALLTNPYKSYIFHKNWKNILNSISFDVDIINLRKAYFNINDNVTGNIKHSLLNSIFYNYFNTKLYLFTCKIKYKILSKIHLSKTKRVNYKNKYNKIKKEIKNVF